MWIGTYVHVCVWLIETETERLAALGRAGQPPAPPSEQQEELYAAAGDALLSGAPGEGRGLLSGACSVFVWLIFCVGSVDTN